MADAPAVLRSLLDATSQSPAHLNWAAVLTTAPPLPELPADVRGRPVLLVPVFSTAPEDDPWLKAARAIGRPVLDTIAPTDFCTFQTSTEEAAPDGMRWDVRSEWLTDLDGTAIDNAVASIAESPSPLSQFLFRPLGGAIAAEAPGTPFSFRHARFMVEIIADWADGDGTAESAWAQRSWNGLRHLTAGGPDVNHLGLDEPSDRVRSAYATEVLGRLAAIKKAYDPDGVLQPPPWATDAD